LPLLDAKRNVLEQQFFAKRFCQIFYSKQVHLFDVVRNCLIGKIKELFAMADFFAIYVKTYIFAF
jgi:hypothetical protein